MAKSKSPSATGAPRSPANAEKDPSASSDPKEAISALEAVEIVIEQERARLMSAEAILHCAVIAMDDDQRSSAHGPHYPTVIDLARGLITQSINRLGSDG